MWILVWYGGLSSRKKLIRFSVGFINSDIHVMDLYAKSEWINALHKASLNSSYFLEGGSAFFIYLSIERGVDSKKMEGV